MHMCVSIMRKWCTDAGSAELARKGCIVAFAQACGAACGVYPKVDDA